MLKPDSAVITEMKAERGFVYFNLNGGDSWAYYHPESNPDYIYNFKGEPSYLLKNKVSIIIDGAFALRSQRKQLIDVAKKQSVKYYILQIHCPDDILKIRTEKRFKEGRGVGFKAHLKIKKIYEPLMEQHYTIDTAKNVNLQLKKFLYSIR
jgi:hypothetical protein